MMSGMNRMMMRRQSHTHHHHHEKDDDVDDEAADDDLEDGDNDMEMLGLSPVHRPLLNPVETSADVQNDDDEDFDHNSELGEFLANLNKAKRGSKSSEGSLFKQQKVTSQGSLDSIASREYVPARKLSIPMKSRIYSVTNYGNVDIDKVNRDLHDDLWEENFHRRPSILPLENEDTRRPSNVSDSDLTATSSFGPRDARERQRRISYTPSVTATSPLPTQSEEDEDFHIGKQKEAKAEEKKILDHVDTDLNSNKLEGQVDEAYYSQKQKNLIRSLSLIENGSSDLSYQALKGVHKDGAVRGLMDVARRGRLYAQRKTRRVIEKNGVCNLNFTKVEKRRMNYLRDLFTTFLEIKWRYTVVVFFLSFCFTWITFALIWWALYAANKDAKECVVGVTDFKTALLFSIETQHTIGYGTRSVTENCPFGFILLMVQSSVGVMIQCIVTGIVFAKLARPKQRANTVMFSKNAVICKQDGDLCLMFRVGNMRRTQMMGTSINAMFVKTKVTTEGDVISFFQENLEITTEGKDDFYCLAWPVKVMHKIDKTSPMWKISAEDLLVADFEIIVVLESVCEATGGSMQVRTSYLPSEIQWGYKLASLFTYTKTGKQKTKFNIDFTQFNKVEPSETPECCAADLASALSRKGSKVSRTRSYFVNELKSNSTMPSIDS